MNPFYTPPRDTVFDKYGDLTLKVGEPPTNYQFSSTVLAGASPVFDAMLNGGFMESGPGIGDWVVRLPADGAKEVRIFLAIVHSNLAAGPVPNEMPLGELHRLLAFTDKYDVTAKIYPWAERWMEAVKSEVEEYCQIVGGLDMALNHEKCQEALEDDLNFDSVTTDSPLTVAPYGDHNHRLDAVIQKGRLTGLGREWTHTGLARECLCESAGFHRIELR